MELNKVRIIKSKFLVFAAACVALVACNKNDNLLNSEPENNAFQAGQVVTISASAGKNTNNAPARRISSQVDDSIISFAWEDNDSVLVKVGEATAVFHVTNISADGKSADLTGTMPLEGTQFDIQFPVNPLPLDTQYYAGENQLPKNVMPFKATGCTLGNTAILAPTKAVLQLNIYEESGMDIDTICVKMGNDYQSYNIDYNLVFETPFVLTGDAQPFFLVVDPDTYYFCVSWHRYDSEDWYSYAETTNAQTFTTGECLNMPACCLAAGTKITMADGTTKNIEDIQIGDLVRTFNHETGTISSEKICLTWKGETKERSLDLTFASGKKVSIIGTHDLLLENTRKYVRVNSNNVASFVGKRFYNAETSTWDELVSYAKSKELVDYYCIYSAYHINCVAEGMLTCPDDVDFCLNIYELDSNLKADAKQLEKDIETYGLYDIYKRFPELADLPEFACSNALYRYGYIAIGKGLVTRQQLLDLVNGNIK